MEMNRISYLIKTGTIIFQTISQRARCRFISIDTDPFDSVELEPKLVALRESINA